MNPENHSSDHHNCTRVQEVCNYSYTFLYNSLIVNTNLYDKKIREKCAILS